MTDKEQLDLFGYIIKPKKKRVVPPFVYEKTPPVKELGRGYWWPYSQDIPGAEALLEGSGVGKALAEVYIVDGRALTLRRRAK